MCGGVGRRRFRRDDRLLLRWWLGAGGEGVRPRRTHDGRGPCRRVHVPGRSRSCAVGCIHDVDVRAAPRRSRRARTLRTSLPHGFVTDLIFLMNCRENLRRKMALQDKKRAVLRHLEIQAVIRGGISYQCTNLSISEYASTIVPGEQEVFTGPGAKMVVGPRRVFNMLPIKAQRLYRRLILISRDLFDTGLALNYVSQGTFTVNSESEHPHLSVRAFQEDLVELDPGTSDDQIDLTMSLLSDVIEQCVLLMGPVPEEVDLGLLPMMRKSGCSIMLYLMANHPSLVPLENQLDLNFRTYVEIKDVLEKADPNGYRQVLSVVDFPQDWRQIIDDNIFMSQFLKGSTYKRTETDPLKIALQVLRYARNSGAHGMEKALDLATNQLQFTRIEIAKMLYVTMPLALHSVMDALHTLNRLEDLRVETLFS